MNHWDALKKLAAGFGDEQRRVPRFVAKSMSCEPKGEVQDFSSGGVRVYFRKNPKLSEGEEFELRLMTETGESMVRVRLQWLRRRGYRCHEAGLAFVDAQAAKNLGLYGFLRDAMLDCDWVAMRDAS